jgi:fibrillarin-like pre-rRNA processing protein
MTEISKHKLPGIFLAEDNQRKTLCTKSLVPGQRVYEEKLIRTDDGEYRLWATRRSKLAAAVQRGLHEMPIQPGSRVLYLGAASGTTVSHVSDIVGPEGVVYAVEFAPRIARGLVQLAQSRKNIVPIIDDARYPSRYAHFLTGPVDIVYQDVAQPDQARILSDNLTTFCSIGSWGLIAIKARSIDSSLDTRIIFERELQILDDSGLEVIENIGLEPYEKDHAFVVCRYVGDMS